MTLPSALEVALEIVGKRMEANGTRTVYHWIIRSNRQVQGSHNRLYWNCDIGWGHINEASVFNTAEAEFYPPIEGGEWFPLAIHLIHDPDNVIIPPVYKGPADNEPADI